MGLERHEGKKQKQKKITIFFIFGGNYPFKSKLIWNITWQRKTDSNEETYDQYFRPPGLASILKGQRSSRLEFSR